MNGSVLIVCSGQTTRRTLMIDVAVIVAFSLGALIGTVVTVVFSIPANMAAFQRGMEWGQDTCPRIHEWGENTG